MSPIAALISRLALLTDASRDLDREIELAVYPWLVRLPKSDDGGWVHPDFGKLRPPSPYTSSIDAAVSLIPDGWRWQVSNRAPHPHTGRAYLSNGELINIGGGLTPNPKYRGAEVTAATPAIAICIAALQARDAQAAAPVLNLGGAR